MKNLWLLRRHIQRQLDTAPAEKRAQLRAALQGLDLLLRATFENRTGARSVERN
jgi:hypothetical protein